MESSKIVGEPKIYLENGGESETPFSYYFAPSLKSPADGELRF